MSVITPGDIVVSAVAFVAAMVTGALGYGFSSITVPVALLFIPARTVAPALVLLELGTNALGLFMHRREVGGVARRMLPLLVGLLPGVGFGAWVLSSSGGAALKIATYAVLLPLVILQTAGLRWTLRRETGPAVLVGSLVGALYAATTISGPPIALFLNNQQLAPRQFRAAVYLIRVVESALTTVGYVALGLFVPSALGLASRLTPSLLIGLPLGLVLLRRVDAEVFRRISMTVSAAIIAFGLARSLREVEAVPGVVAYGGAVVVFALEGVLLARFFARRREASG